MRLTYLVDIAGRIARTTAGAEFVSAGGVCLPSGALRSIRKRLPADLPKWRDASDQHLSIVLKAIRRDAFSATAFVCNKATPEWSAFWEDAEAVHARTTALPGGRITFLKAATQIRYLLFAQVVALTGAHAIREHTFPRSHGRATQLLIEEEHIYDREIDGEDNVKAFHEIWDARNEEQPLTASLGIQMKAASIGFKTEQEEPLLLLADYVAGIAQSRNSTANTLQRSNVSQSAATEAYDELHSWKGYAEVRENFNLNFFEIFPAFRQLPHSVA